MLRRQARDEGLAPVDAKRVYRVMSENSQLLPHDRPQRPIPGREYNDKVTVAKSDQRWCSDGFEFGCDNGEKLRATFALGYCDREAIDWAASTVQDVMLGAVKHRFGQQLPVQPIQWLTGNGSCYRPHETRRFPRMLGLEPCTTAVCSP